jgi:heptosyltransferase-2
MPKRPIDRILVIQTAFLGDVILTLPLVQVLKEFKRGKDRGAAGLWKLGAQLRQERYGIALVPHRSLRSAVLPVLARIPIRVGFIKSAGRFLFTKRVAYDADVHEIDRNLSLLTGIGIGKYPFRRPSVHPSPEDASIVAGFLSESFGRELPALVAIAPGTVWNTKRWFKERFAELARECVADGMGVVLIGGGNDAELCKEIKSAAKVTGIADASGRFSLLQSAELIKRCQALVCNDSAPLHLATAVGTPVVAIFGATVPEFGFGPVGEKNQVVETRGLSCRPCSIHGGERCPIKTFECMDRITVERVLARVHKVLEA